MQEAAPRARFGHRERGNGDVVEIADTAVVRGTPVIAAKRPQPAAASRAGAGFAPLAAVAASQWRALAERANEPNGYYLPDWELAVNASARGRTGVSALAAWSDASPASDGAARLIGLLPAISMWRAYKIPLPALVSADPYGTLGTPPLDRDLAEDAAAGLMREARKAGAHALILRDVALDGAAIKTFTEVLRQGGMRPRLLQSHLRACLDATRDADELLRDALGPKKLKELRRQRNRLAEHGEVRFEVARTPQEIASAVEIFLTLEASGWKGQRGTALKQHDGDADFRPPRHRGPRRIRPMRDRDAARRRYAGRGRDRAAASGSRVLLQARRRRAFCKTVARRAADARPDAASLRRSRYRAWSIPPPTPIIP